MERETDARSNPSTTSLVTAAELREQSAMSGVSLIYLSVYGRLRGSDANRTNPPSQDRQGGPADTTAQLQQILQSVLDILDDDDEW
jgi:hypothetical protein